MYIDMPAMVIKKLITRELYVIHVGQEIEQRISRRRNQELVTGIAQQTKNERVRFTGAGSQDEIINGDAFTKRRIIIAHSLPGRFQSLWIRMILQRGGSAECAHDCKCVIL